MTKATTKKTVFVTGVTGFLGSHITKLLCSEGHTVRGLSRSSASVKLLAGLPVEYLRGDITDPSSYIDALPGCDTVIHTAALATFGEKDPSIYDKINFNGTRLLLDSSLKCGVKRFIHTGTRGTLGVAPNPEDSSEDTLEGTGPKDVADADDYIKSKLKADNAVRKAAALGDTQCLILSPTALVGAYDEKPTPIGSIIQSFLSGGVKSWMEGGINLIDVEDAAGAFLAALSKGESGKTYILGCHNIRLYDLFTALSKISNVPAPSLKIPYTPALVAAGLMEVFSKLTGKRMPYTRKKVKTLSQRRSYASSSLAKKELGLNCTPLEETLEKTCDWFRGELKNGREG